MRDGEEVLEQLTVKQFRSIAKMFVNEYSKEQLTTEQVEKLADEALDYYPFDDWNYIVGVAVERLFEDKGLEIFY